MTAGEPRVPQMRNSEPSVPDMTPEEAIETYQTWRRRVIGDRDTRASSEEELYAQLRAG